MARSAFSLRAISCIWRFYQKRALTAVACDYVARTAHHGTLDYFVVIGISSDNLEGIHNTHQRRKLRYVISSSVGALKCISQCILFYHTLLYITYETNALLTSWQ
jgi:hypothetical protein